VHRRPFPAGYGPITGILVPQYSPLPIGRRSCAGGVAFVPPTAEAFATAAVPIRGLGANANYLAHRARCRTPPIRRLPQWTIPRCECPTMPRGCLYDRCATFLTAYAPPTPSSWDAAHAHMLLLTRQYDAGRALHLQAADRPLYREPFRTVVTGSYLTTSTPRPRAHATRAHRANPQATPLFVTSPRCGGRCRFRGAVSRTGPCSR